MAHNIIKFTIHYLLEVRLGYSPCTISVIDGPDYNPPPGNYRFSPLMDRSCLDIQIRADAFYEVTETFMGVLTELVNENGQRVDSISGVILEPRETDIQILDIDGEHMYCSKIFSSTLV